MSKPKKQRATVIVEWSHAGKSGILVHADSYKNEWILPGGGLEQDANGQVELPKVAAARELEEETSLTVEAVAALFCHSGRFRDHHVFQVNARGTLQIIDRKEAPAFGLCGPDLVVTTILGVPGYTTDRLSLSASTKAIIRRYLQMQGANGTLTPATASV